MTKNYRLGPVKQFIQPALAVAMTVAFAVLAFNRPDFNDSSFLTSLENRWDDARFLIRGRHTAGNEIVVVGIDAKTLSALGPYPEIDRLHYAKLVRLLSNAGVRAIGFDVVFNGTADPASDEAFALALRQAGNAVLGILLDRQPDGTSKIQELPISGEERRPLDEKSAIPAESRLGSVSGETPQLPPPVLTSAASSLGFMNFHPDAQGRVRLQPQLINHQDLLFASLSLQVLQTYVGGRLSVAESASDFTRLQAGGSIIPTDRHGQLLLNFTGPGGSYHTVSMIDVLNGLRSVEELRGKIVLIGPVAAGWAPAWQTPFGALSNVELHANVIDSLLHRNYVVRSTPIQLLDIAFILVFGIWAGVCLPVESGKSTTLAASLMILFTLVNLLSFLSLQWLLGFVYPVTALVVISGTLISWKCLTEGPDRKRKQHAFEDYLAPSVIEEVRVRHEGLTLHGEREEMSVLISDIRGFTSFCEKMAPEEVVGFLNLYFERMTAIIFQYKGTLDKMIGDAVMCFWGHPIRGDDHALRSTLCALEIVQAVEELRPVLRLPGGAKFDISVGVNTGRMIVGNMGSPTRASYTVVGDNVSMGFRLGSLNKIYGTRVLISESTFEACKDLIRCRELDTISIKGRAATVYEPLGLHPFEADRRKSDRRSRMTRVKKIMESIFKLMLGERRIETRRLGSEALVVRPEQEKVAVIYEDALALYRKGDLEGAEKAFDRALSLNPSDGPSRMMKGRISAFLQEHGHNDPQFDPVLKFDKK